MKYLFNKCLGKYFKEQKKKFLPVIIFTVILLIMPAMFTGCLNTVSGKQGPGEETAEKQLSNNNNDSGKNTETSSKNNDGQHQDLQGGSLNGKSGGSAQIDENTSETKNPDDHEATVQEEKVPVLKPPAVKLEIISGPELAQDNSICFYRVKAIAEGEPVPQVQFNRDDSNGVWGENIAQVNLLKGQSFTLICNASNIEGTAQSSVEVTWKEPGQNSEVTQESSQAGYSDPLNYYIDVNLSLQEVKVIYNGSTIRVMPCSGGLPETPTPLGTYKTNEKIYWAYVPRFEQGAYFWTRFYGSYLFHSVPHDENKNMLLEEYAKIGSPASHGCIRLYLEDAKWMYENLPLGIEVNIHN